MDCTVTFELLNSQWQLIYTEVLKKEKILKLYLLNFYLLAMNHNNYSMCFQLILLILVIALNMFYCQSIFIEHLYSQACTFQQSYVPSSCAALIIWLDSDELKHS